MVKTTIHISLEPDEKKEIQKKAIDAEMTLSEFLIKCATYVQFPKQYKKK